MYKLSLREILSLLAGALIMTMTVYAFITPDPVSPEFSLEDYEYANEIADNLDRTADVLLEHKKIYKHQLGLEE